MSYFRLRDIKTPPFAYVTNREEAVTVCPLCNMPYRQLQCPLKVEIFSTDVSNWKGLIIGKPLMAEFWLIGEQTFAARLERLLPGAFDRFPVEISSWLVRNPGRIMTPDKNSAPNREELPTFFLFMPKAEVPIDSSLVQQFPPIPCGECQREIPDIPFDYQVAPYSGPNQPIAASLKDLYYDGYDYLFHTSVVEQVRQAFPEMILEEPDYQLQLF